MSSLCVCVSICVVFVLLFVLFSLVTVVICCCYSPVSSLNRSGKSFKEKQRSKKPVSIACFSFSWILTFFDSFFHFQKDDFKNRENVQSGKKERRVLWLIDQLSKTFLSLILLLINILINLDPKTHTVAQKDLPLKNL